MPGFTAPPDAPTRADGSSRATFVAKCNAFIAWFATFVAELIAFAAALTTYSTNDTSTTSNDITGAVGTTKTFTVTAGKSWQLGQQLLIASTADPSKWMFGTVTSYASTTLQVLISAIQNTGTAIAAWTISASGPQGSAGSAALTTAANSWTAAQRGTPVALADASTVAINAALSNNFYVTLGGNRTLGTPTNLVAGQSGSIDIFQDGTGTRTLAYEWPWQFAGGTAPTLSTAIRAKDKLTYSVDWYSTTTVTMTIAAPCVITLASGIPIGTPCRFTTTGALPTGLVAGTTYYLIPSGASAYNVAATPTGAVITTTGSQSGTHTIIVCSITAALIANVK